MYEINSALFWVLFTLFLGGVIGLFVLLLLAGKGRAEDQRKLFKAGIDLVRWQQNFDKATVDLFNAELSRLQYEDAVAKLTLLLFQQHGLAVDTYSDEELIEMYIDLQNAKDDVELKEFSDTYLATS